MTQESSQCTPETMPDPEGVFRARFGRKPGWIAAAPGRVNLIGEHVDYNDGLVLPMAIDRSCHVAGGPNDSNEFVIYSAQRDEEARFSLDDMSPEPTGSFGDYFRGIIAGFQTRGHEVPGFQAALSSDVPIGSGLSSSAALEVAAATFIEAMLGIELAPLEKALLCQQAEQKFVGVPCGLMDQYASVFGKSDQLILLDCETEESRYVPFDDPAVGVLVINSNVHHQLDDGQYALRRQQCEAAAARLGLLSLRHLSPEDFENRSAELEPIELRRVRHVISENERTKAAAEAIARRDWRLTGDLMFQSHSSLRDDYQVSCDELDAIVELCRTIGEEGGVHGCRMTGAGFGGCAIALIRADQTDIIAARVSEEYGRLTGIKPTLFTTRPAEGARVIG